MAKAKKDKLRRLDLASETLRIFREAAQKYRTMVLLCMLGMIVLVACDMVYPLVFRALLDKLVGTRLRPEAVLDLSSIHIMVWKLGLVMLISFIASRSLVKALQIFECWAMKDLADRCFAYLQNHSHRFFTDHFGGALVKRVNRFSAAFEVIADQCTFNMGQTVLRVGGVIGILLWLHPLVGLLFLAWAVVFIGFNIGFSRWKMKYDLARADMDTKVTAQLADTITNATNLKLFAGISREISGFMGITEEHRRARYRSWDLGWLSEMIQGFSIRALELVVIFIAVDQWAAGKMTIGDFVLLRSYLSQLTENVRSIGQDIRKIYESMADANEMTEILLTPHEVVDDERATALRVPRGTIEFQNVNFAYQKESPTVIEGFALKIAGGERVGIVGPSGGGKSTILKLLVRLYDVNGGAILVDDQDISLVTQQSLHENIAYVPQDPILFHRTLMENIRYARPHATDEEVIRAAKVAHCHEFITDFPAGYMTLVGERGVKLSGGQRQRVAIARAVLMNAPIIVLDEATSSLDSESETYIQDSLSKLFADRTVIAVAHRLSTVRKMDRIVVVKDGRILEEGKHELLVKVENGFYRKLWELQSTTESPLDEGSTALAPA